MRLLVLALALLAGAKVWYQDTLFRAGAEEALVAAYRARAIEACQKEPHRSPRGDNLTSFPPDWAHPVTIELSAGNRSARVNLWDVDNPRWNVRFRNPHLLLAPGDRHAGLFCAFDVVTGEAELQRL